MAQKIMWAGGAVLSIGGALFAIGLAFFIGGVTWPMITTFQHRALPIVQQSQWEAAVLRPLGLYLAGAGLVILLLGGLLGGFGYLRRRSETI